MLNDNRFIPCSSDRRSISTERVALAKAMTACEQSTNALGAALKTAEVTTESRL